MYAVTYQLLPPTLQRNPTDIRLPCRATDILPTKLLTSSHFTLRSDKAQRQYTQLSKVKKYNKMVSFVIR